MSRLKYLDTKGTFQLENPDLTGYLYFPLANEAGMMSAITPDLGGDIKLDQNTFLLEPVSAENLHNNNLREISGSLWKEKVHGLPRDVRVRSRQSYFLMTRKK